MSAARVSMAVTGVLLAGVAMASPPPHARYERSSSTEYDYAPVRARGAHRPAGACRDPARGNATTTFSTSSRARISAIPMSAAGPWSAALIGGVVGHQFGSGRGRDAATVAGATIGAAVGYDAAARRSASVREEIVQRCEVRYEKRYEERVDGYRVTYEYHGREYTTRLPYDPGERIRVRVAVAVAE